MSNIVKINKKIKDFKKTISVPGDKSLSIRWVLFASLANGTSKAKNLLMSEDVLAAIEAIKKLGIKVIITKKECKIFGRGINGYKYKKLTINAKNSGTLGRLILGLLVNSTEPINLIGLIESKKGTIRANHYHPQQEQKCLFTKGQIIEIFQDIINPNSPKITQVVNAGQLSVIKPNVAHTMVFTKDTTFLNLVRGERDHENYGITHTIKHVFVDEKEKNLLLKYYKFECRSCGNSDLKRVVSLGYQPLANNLLKKEKEKCELYPLEVN